MSASLRVLKSAGLLLGIQVVQRGLGIISTLILARLLAPEHFGIIALVTIALQFFELLVETGNQQYIVQKDTLDDEDLNTAWSMQVFRGFVLGLVVTTAIMFTSEFRDWPSFFAGVAYGVIIDWVATRYS